MLRPEYPIETPRLLLRPFTMDDLDPLHETLSRPEVVRFLYFDVLTREEVREKLADRAKATELTAEQPTLRLAVDRRDTGELIGDVMLRRISAEYEQGEIGFIFHPDHHGQGFAYEAAREMLRLGFDELGLHRIIGRCDARNHASSGLLERLGMRREALFRENEFVKGEWCDELVLAILAKEWADRG
ncbi:GNAT family N-acetyltransferase [Amycolatopsis anabasis]|uniref:GNAT family N-acetyltransferase n=1 Tax=Amycolatopsis anabasis TaxID=1840409 RepID=UPI00131E6494|nr:GNAT family N-acetyltransferase [Amycolatopsis anabasis]